MLIGEVSDAIHNTGKESLIYHNSKYWSFQSIAKPDQETRQRIKDILRNIGKIHNSGDEI